jgi:hypothetical protein
MFHKGLARNAMPRAAKLASYRTEADHFSGTLMVAISWTRYRESPETIEACLGASPCVAV